jgi:hypothetical protein
MAAEITFDEAYRIQGQEIQGGRFLSAAEFDAAADPDRAAPPAG